GFPDHPHRGFETITYMLAGRMRHRDSAGHEGLLEDGSVQWMVAGRGVIHSELPEQRDGVMEGFQLWLNLPARDKMCQPWYQDFSRSEIPGYTTEEGVRIQVIAGESGGVAGAVNRPYTEPLYLDIHLPAASSLNCSIPSEHNAFFYLYRGAVSVADQLVDTPRMAILTNCTDADGVTISAGSDARLILIAGKPLREPIVQYGPFVMNSQQEIQQAIDDFSSRRYT
ncbi:MAG: pirin family protein, partial [Gammaproteobacteria bacterium]|nr:pirin family protein [Gammaproteobacteria bacterium]